MTNGKASRYDRLSVLLLTITLAVFAPVIAEGNSQPSASELLREFARAQRPLQSFLAQYEYTRQDEVLAPEAWKGRHSIVGEIRFDGKRIRDRSRWWGQIVPSVTRTKDRPYCKSYLFDGQWGYHYEQPYWRLDDIPNRQVGTGTLMLREMSSPPKDLIEALQFCGSAFMIGLGVLPHDAERLDLRLQEASSIRVREKREPAGWIPSPCYVLEAETPHGHYTVWLDPAHGHQMAKAILRREPGHRRGSWTLQSNEHDLSFVEKVRFAKAGSLWVPVEYQGGLDNTFAGGHRSRMRGHLKVTRFLMNPDHEALHSFVPDDIRDGARVYYPNKEKKPPGFWKEGRVVDKEGTVLLTPSPQLIEWRQAANGPTAVPPAAKP